MPSLSLPDAPVAGTSAAIRLIATVNEALAASPLMRPALALCAEAIAGHTGAVAFIWTLMPHGRTYQLQAAAGAVPDEIGHLERFSPGPDGALPEVGCTSSFDHHSAGMPASPGLSKHPLVARGGQVGLLGLCSGRPLAPDDEAAVRACAAAIGVAVDRWATHDDYARFFELSQDMLCIGGPDGRFKHVSPAWTRTLGYPETELLETPFVELLHPDDLPHYDRLAERLARGARTLSFELRFRHKDGSTRSLAWNVSVSRNPWRFYAVARDVTVARRAA